METTQTIERTASMDLIGKMKALKAQLYKREDQLITEIAECKKGLAQLRRELSETKKAIGRSVGSPSYAPVESKGLTGWVKERLEEAPATSCQIRNEFFGDRVMTKAERRTALSSVNTCLSLMKKNGLVVADGKADFSHGRVFRMNGVAGDHLPNAFSKTA